MFSLVSKTCLFQRRATAATGSQGTDIYLLQFLKWFPGKAVAPFIVLGFGVQGAKHWVSLEGCAAKKKSCLKEIPLMAEQEYFKYH